MAEISLTGNQMLGVLEAVAREGPISAAEVARVCDINRTIAYRLLNTLAARAYIRRGAEGYTVGPGVLQLVNNVDFDLRTIAKPLMVKLAQDIGETIVLHAIDNLEAVVIDQAVGQKHLVRVEHTPGSRHSLTKGASGWSLLAFQDDRLIERVVRKAEGDATIRERITETRSQGFSVSHDELQLGVHGVAVPVVENSSRCQVSLGILLPAVRSGKLMDYVSPLKETAAEIARKL